MLGFTLSLHLDSMGGSMGLGIVAACHLSKPWTLAHTNPSHPTRCQSARSVFTKLQSSYQGTTGAKHPRILQGDTI